MDMDTRRTRRERDETHTHRHQRGTKTDRNQRGKETALTRLTGCSQELKQKWRNNKTREPHNSKHTALTASLRMLSFDLVFIGYKLRLRAASEFFRFRGLSRFSQRLGGCYCLQKKKITSAFISLLTSLLSACCGLWRFVAASCDRTVPTAALPPSPHGSGPLFPAPSVCPSPPSLTAPPDSPLSLSNSGHSGRAAAQRTHRCDPIRSARIGQQQPFGVRCGSADERDAHQRRCGGRRAHVALSIDCASG